MLKNFKGITLIALVITIIVLIILAIISTNMILGEEGILEKVKQAKQDTTNSQAEEQQILADANNSIDEYIIGEREKTSTVEHSSITSSLFTVHSIGNANTTMSASTRNIASFTNYISQSDNFSNYFTYDTENNKLICKKAGQYILNLSCRANRVSDGALYGSFLINNVSVDWQDNFADAGTSNVLVANTLTIYLNENDIVDFAIKNTGQLRYYNVSFYVYAN